MTKKVLLSQPEPVDINLSPYKKLVKEQEVDITFFKFFDIVGITASEFRRTRIRIGDHTAVIFNSKNSIDHFFRMLKELRETISDDMKYYCISDAVANYLQKYIQYRKRKVFQCNQDFAAMVDLISKARDEKFIFPCSDEKQNEYTKALDKAKIKYTKAPMYTFKERDLSQFDLTDYDVVALFSPNGVKSLVKSFPNIKEMNVRIAAIGPSTHAALKEHGIPLSIPVPTPNSPSMALAIENFYMGKAPDPVAPTRRPRAKAAPKTPTAPAGKKTKTVIADKEVYKRRMEAKKAETAARRAERAAERAKKQETQE